MITNQENIKNLILNEIKDFIYSKKDEGIYRKRTIFGIKIITKPYELILNDKLDKILHDYDNLIWGGGK